MTLKEIDSLSGYDLNVNVFLKVFDEEPEAVPSRVNITDWAGDIADAWLVMDELDRREYLVTIKNYPGLGVGPTRYEVEITKWGTHLDVCGSANTAPEAICRAAIKAAVSDA